MHDLLDREPLLSALSERWGPEVVVDGNVDRTAVGSRVFNNPDELAWLESEVHPLVRTELMGWFTKLPPEANVAVVEVPLLFEGEMAGYFDLTIAIVADESVRQERARSRGHAGVEGRETRQLTQDEKAAHATHVIENNGTPEELERKLADLVAEVTVRKSL